jgi:enterochelin esterase family protein
MMKDESGVWTTTTPALKPDLHAYSFDVDGLTIPDPSNPLTRPSYKRPGQSAVLVPGDMPWTP